VDPVQTGAPGATAREQGQWVSVEL
jgi:hypothetical protein